MIDIWNFCNGMLNILLFFLYIVFILLHCNTYTYHLPLQLSESNISIHTWSYENQEAVKTYARDHWTYSIREES
jgi:hypothetical protein